MITHFPRSISVSPSEATLVPSITPGAAINMNHIEASHCPPKERYVKELTLEHVSQRVRHPTGKEECLPGGLVFRTENDTLVIFSRGQRLLASHCVANTADEADRFDRTAQPRSCQIPPPRIRSDERRSKDNHRCCGDDRDRHPQKYQHRTKWSHQSPH
jgi:hypothetical protein